MPDRLWTPREVAAFLQVSRDWVYRRTSAGEIPCIRLGGHIRYDPEKIRAWATGQTQPARVVHLGGRRG